MAKKTVKLGELLSGVATKEEIEEAVKEIEAWNMKHKKMPQSHDQWQVVEPEEPKDEGPKFVWKPRG